MAEFDAVVGGGGPNGLAAALRLAEAGWSVCLVEANQEVGGSARTLECTLPGFRHDLGAGFLPLASAAVPPGAGVHGGCGDLAARQAIADHHRPTRAITAAAGVGLAAVGTTGLRSHTRRRSS